MSKEVERIDNFRALACMIMKEYLQQCILLSVKVADLLPRALFLYFFVLF